MYLVTNTSLSFLFHVNFNLGVRIPFITHPYLLFFYFFFPFFPLTKLRWRGLKSDKFNKNQWDSPDRVKWSVAKFKIRVFGRRDNRAQLAAGGPSVGEPKYEMHDMIHTQ